MVKFRNSREPYNRHDWLKDYWKVEHDNDLTIATLQHALTRREFAFRKDLSKDRLQYLYSRAQRGMISYQRCSVLDLRKFCDQRKIDPQNAKSKAALIEVLESADENQVFTKLFDLPPEIRNIVYEHSFSMFDVENAFLPPPPVAAVSKVLRKEVVPLFYQFHRPDMQFSICTHHGPHFLRDIAHFFDVERPGTLRPDTFQFVQKFSVSSIGDAFQWCVDLSRQENNYILTRRETGEVNGDRLEFLEQVERKLKVVLKRMVSREEGLMLRVEDANFFLELLDGPDETKS